MKIEAKITGDKELGRDLKLLSEWSRKEFRAALLELGQEKLVVMQQRVPYKTGALHDTGRVSVRVGAKQVVLAIRFGSPEAWYAARAHEDLETQFEGGRQAKYAESVALETDLGMELARKVDLAEAL
jgi:hypothetical protein